jgi:hypothetical protein
VWTWMEVLVSRVLGIVVGWLVLYLPGRFDTSGEWWTRDF